MTWPTNEEWFFIMQAVWFMLLMLKLIDIHNSLDSLNLAVKLLSNSSKD